MDDQKRVARRICGRLKIQDRRLGEGIQQLAAVLASPQKLSLSTSRGLTKKNEKKSKNESLPRLSTFSDSVSQVSESVFSETTAALFAEIDQKLQELVLKEDPEQFKKVLAASIPTDIPNGLRKPTFLTVQGFPVKILSCGARGPPGCRRAPAKAGQYVVENPSCALLAGAFARLA